MFADWQTQQKRRYILDNLRGDHLAGTTPCCKGVENNDLVILQSRVELALTVNTTASASP